MNHLKFTSRQLWKNPGFTALAVTTLALGIGLVATQFSVLDAILLRGLPIDDAQRLLHVTRLNPQTRNADYWEKVPYRDYLMFRDQQTSLESLAAVNPMGVNLSGKGRVPSHHDAAMATANLAEVLAVGPQLGRWFEVGEDRAGQALLAVLSDGMWRNQFGGDPGVLGRAVTLNGEAATIIGVMPPEFAFPQSEDLWLNLRAEPSDPRDRLATRVEMVGKVKPGVSLDRARAEFNTIAQLLEKEYPETNLGYTEMNVEKFTFAYSGGGTEPILYLMMAMTVFILALACVNVANMLLGRASRRTRELAVRSAIGAGRWHLIRQFLMESLVLAGLGAMGGLLLAWVGVDQMQYHISERMNVPGWFEFRLDYRVVVFASLLTVLAGLLAGVVPAWQAARVDVNAALKDDSRGASSLKLGRLSRWLVTAQIAFSSALLVCVCIVGAMVFLMRQVNLEYQPEQLLSGRIELHDANYPEPEDRSRFYQNLMDRLAAEPGVQSVAVTSRNLVHPGVQTRIVPEGVVYEHANQHPQVWLEVVSAGYFQLLNIAATEGRLFDERDRPESPLAAVINEPMARRLWPDSDPIGKRFQSEQTDDQWATVVGVVPDTRMQGLFSPNQEDGAGFFLVQNQMGWGWLNLFARVQGDPVLLVEPIRQAVAGLDADQPVHTIGTLAEHTARQIRGFSVIGAMSGIFALVTVFLGMIGVYGVTSFAVSQRTREFGIRMALGASIQSVLKLVFRQAGQQILIGLVLGLAVAFFLSRPMQNVFLPEVVNDPFIYLGVTLLILVVGLVAIWAPARRATRIDPMDALRDE